MEKLTIKDINNLKPFIEKAGYHEYNSNVVTMMMWQFSYPTTFEIHDHFAVVKWHYGDECSWMMPLCEITYRKEAMDYMRSYCKQHNGEFTISSATEEFKQWCIQEYPDAFIYEDYFDAQDYVYESETQRTLSGKKMQKRRNHYNAFLKSYEDRFMYKDLKDMNHDEILRYLDEWNSSHEPSPSLDSERKGIQFLLQHHQPLALCGGGIYIDGELKAFLIASELSQDTLEIHVEKADREIRGLYIAMLKHFLMHQDERFTYLNREDDMGLDHLRKAKMNMHPIYKIKKYGIYDNKVTIRKANHTDKVQIQQLWEESFVEETPATTEFFFQYLYQQDECYVVMQNEEVLSMLQCRKMKLQVNDQQENISFIIGVATKKSYQHNGFMSKLMHHVLATLQQEEVLTVLQAYDWNLYKPFGFEITHERQKTKLKLSKQIHLSYTFKETKDTEELLQIYHDFCSQKNGYRIRDKQYYEQYFLPYVACEGGSFIVVYDESHEAVGSMLIQDHVCSEYMPLNDEANAQMLQYLHQEYHDMIIFADTKIDIPGEKEVLPCLMTLFHQPIKFEQPAYINEVL